VSSIEERVEKLEQAVFENRKPGEKDWRRTIGMFDGDPVMKEIIDESLRLRDEERAQVNAENGTAQ